MPDRNFSAKNLHDVLTSSFDLDELRLLCFELKESGVAGLEFESLEGSGKNAKALALVEFFERRGELSRLGEVVREKRPNAAVVISPVITQPEPLTEVRQIHVVALSQAGENGSAPVDLESLAAAGENGDIAYEEGGGKLFLSSSGDLRALLRRAIAVMKALGGQAESAWRAGVHSEKLCVGPGATKTIKIPDYCKALASRVMELGSGGHIIASRRAAHLLMAEPQFAPSVHPGGESAGRCHDRLDIYNIYGDGFGNPQPPRLKAAPHKRVLGKLRRLFRRAKREDEATAWVLLRHRIPEVIHTTRPEKIELTFCPFLSYVRVQFDAGDEFQIAKDSGPQISECRRLGPRQFDCKFDQTDDYNRLAFRVTAKGVTDDSSGIIIIRCYDASDRLIAPPVEASIILRRRWMFVHRLLSPYYFFKDSSRKVKFILASALLLAAFVAGYKFIPFRRLTHSLKHFGESVLIHAHAPGYPARSADQWSDPVKSNDPPLEGRWSFPPGKWGIADAYNGDPDDAAIKTMGWGLGVPKGLGERSFYDFKLNSSVTFYQGHKLAWALRLQPGWQEKGLSGYVFELVKEGDDLIYGDKLSLNTYLYQDGRSTLINHQGVPITQCCIEGDTITVEATADRYDFDYTFSLQGDPESEGTGRRDDVDTPKHIHVTVGRGPYYRSGSFGILGTDDGTKDAPRDVRVEKWTITPVFDPLDF